MRKRLPAVGGGRIGIGVGASLTAAGLEATNGAGGAYPGGGGAMVEKSAAPAGKGAAGTPAASSSRATREVTYSEASRPQFEQTNRTGCPRISGVTSRLYFEPQEH